jgi:hypothetical protein
MAVVFLMAGSSKLAGAEYAVVAFDAIGLGQWFRYLTGGLEVLGALALLTPPLAGLGALLLACVMAGAVAAHMFVLGGSITAAAVLLALSVLVAFGRRGRTARLLGR